MYALSYDEPDALADFRAAHGISYPLLSDPDSAVIEAFGILNTLIPPDDHPWYGIPFPGVYVIDADGLITQKFFEHSLAVRAGPEQLLAAARGDDVALDAPVGQPVDQPVDQVTVEVAFEGGTLPPGLQRDLVARFSVPDGQHLYGEPVPEGLLAATVQLDPDPDILAFDLVRPATRPLTLAGTGETLQVHDGDVVLRLPVTQNGSAGVKVEGRRVITLEGEVRWQACDDTQCGLPLRQRFRIEVEAGRIVRPDIGPAAAAGQAVPMNGAAHLARMTERRQ